jgi:hypothetical protein
MRSLLVIGLFILMQMASSAQNYDDGRVVVIQDQLVDTVLQQYEAMRLRIMENPDNKAIPGYRIQIFFDSGINSSDRAKQARDEFLFLFPDVPAYVSWKAPNYRVRVGDFRNRLEAEKVLQSILIGYPNAWVIKDEINFPILN